MKKAILATALIVLPALAFAKGRHHDETPIHYMGPVEVVTVESLLQNSSMFTEEDVIVEGKLVRQINKDTFIFSDGKAEIQVELDDDIRLDSPLDNNTQVRLFGEFEGGKTPEIEVEHLQVL